MKVPEVALTAIEPFHVAPVVHGLPCCLRGPWSSMLPPWSMVFHVASVVHGVPYPPKSIHVEGSLWGVQWVTQLASLAVQPTSLA